MGAGTLFLVFGTSAPSYVKTAFHKVRQTAKDAVNPQFDIDRARTGHRQPEADVPAEHRDAGPGRGRGRESGARRSITVQANLDERKEDDAVHAGQAQDGEFRLAGHVADTADEVKAELAHRLDHYHRHVRASQGRSRPPSRPSRMIIKAAHAAARKLEDPEVGAAWPSWPASRPSCADRGQPGQERVPLRRQCPGECQAARSRSWKRSSTSWPGKSEIEGRYSERAESLVGLCRSPRDVVKEVDDTLGQSSSHLPSKTGDKSL